MYETFTIEQTLHSPNFGYDYSINFYVHDILHTILAPETKNNAPSTMFFILIRLSLSRKEKSE